MIGHPKFIRFAWIATVIAGLFLVLAAWLTTQYPPEQLPVLLEVGGNLHPLILHLPIGIFTYALLAELLSRFNRSTRMSDRFFGTQIALGIGAASSFITAGFGLLLYMQGDYEGSFVKIHLWSGVAFSVSSSTAFLFSLRSEQGSFRYPLILILSFVLLLLTGHYGGLMTHGDPLDPLHRASALVKNDRQPEDLLLYEDGIIPIFESKCYECHSTGRKRKGGLLMDSYDALLSGGREGSTLVPGSTENSLLSKYIHLPSGDELHMPPEGKLQLTDEEIQLIDFWIDSGAAQAMRLADLNLPEDLLLSLIASNSSENDLEKAVALTEEPISLQSLTDTIQRVEDLLGSSISRYGPAGDQLAFSSVNAVTSVNDEKLEALNELMPYLFDLNLSRTQVSTTAVAALFDQSKEIRLKHLNLSGTKIDDAVLHSLPTSLESLILFETAITSNALPALCQFRNLKTLYLANTEMTEEDIRILQRVLPQTQIIGRL
ncbi:MAG: c-type cytochrome domain-containing protein [Coraliomargaritaceae bacterium]